MGILFLCTFFRLTLEKKSCLWQRKSWNRPRRRQSQRKMLTPSCRRECYRSTETSRCGSETIKNDWQQSETAGVSPSQEPHKRINTKIPCRFKCIQTTEMNASMGIMDVCRFEVRKWKIWNSQLCCLLCWCCTSCCELIEISFPAVYSACSELLPHSKMYTYK